MKQARWWKTRTPFAAVCMIALLASGCVSERSPVTGEKQAYGYSWEQELQIGAQADQELMAEMGVYDDPELQAYVERVGQAVLEQSNMRGPNALEQYRDTPFQFRVINSPVVNAFALPGGYVYVTRGLLSHLQNEAQLAVVLGHEIAHVAGRHASEQALRAQAGQLGLIAGAILGEQVFGGQGTDIASTVLDLGGTALQLFMFRYSRGAEEESDELGVSYAAKAGYATAEASHFFRSLQRISEAEGARLPSWASTHPDPGDRAQKVVSLSQSAPRPDGATPLVREQEYMRELDGIVLGADPREGFTENGVFYHPGMRFQFPVPLGWKVQNEQTVVIMGEPNQRAIMGFQLAPGSDARAAATQFVEQSGVQPVSLQSVQINGMPAAALVAQASTEQGTVGISNVFVQFEDRVFSFLGYSPAQVFPQFQSTFAAVAGGFAPLRDQSKLNVEPTRLRIARPDSDRRFRDLLPGTLPPDTTAEELAILNQVGLDDVIPAGRTVKLPR